jgi:hypothetical protein
MPEALRIYLYLRAEKLKKQYPNVGPGGCLAPCCVAQPYDLAAESGETARIFLPRDPG